MSVAKEIRDLMGRCSRLEQQIAKLPTRIGNSAGGGGGTSKIWTTAATKAGLDNDSVSETLLGRVTEGPRKGMVCVRNPENDGWDSINYLE